MKDTSSIDEKGSDVCQIAKKCDIEMDRKCVMGCRINLLLTMSKCYFM